LKFVVSFAQFCEGIHNLNILNLYSFHFSFNVFSQNEVLHNQGMMLQEAHMYLEDDLYQTNLLHETQIFWTLHYHNYNRYSHKYTQLLIWTPCSFQISVTQMLLERGTTQILIWQFLGERYHCIACMVFLVIIDN